MRLVFILLSCLTVLSSQTLSPEEQISRAQILHREGDLRKAAQILSEVLRDVQGSPEWLARAYADMGVVCHDQGKVLDAEHWHLKARQTVVPRSSLHLQVLNNLSSLYLESGQYGKAERIVNEMEGFQVPERDLMLRSKGSTASLYMARGRNKEAERLFLELLEEWERIGNRRDAAVALSNLGVLAMDRGDVPVALTNLRRSNELWRSELGGDHVMFVHTMANYGGALLVSGQANAAEDQLSRALAIADRWHGPEGKLTLQIANLYAKVLHSNGRKKEAKDLRQRVERASSAMMPKTVDVLDFKNKQR